MTESPFLESSKALYNPPLYENGRIKQSPSPFNIRDPNTMAIHANRTLIQENTKPSDQLVYEYKNSIKVR